jgi:hypothetical protein
MHTVKGIEVVGSSKKILLLAQKYISLNDLWHLALEQCIILLQARIWFLLKPQKSKYMSIDINNFQTKFY